MSYWYWKKCSATMDSKKVILDLNNENNQFHIPNNFKRTNCITNLLSTNTSHIRIDFVQCREKSIFDMDSPIVIRVWDKWQPMNVNKRFHGIADRQWIVLPNPSMSGVWTKFFRVPIHRLNQPPPGRYPPIILGVLECTCECENDHSP